MLNTKQAQSNNLRMHTVARWLSLSRINWSAFTHEQIEAVIFQATESGKDLLRRKACRALHRRQRNTAIR
jgi:hypothetical protein